jgi:hypothetical protein
VARYVITITPDTADAAGAASAQTTVRVDTSSGQTRITELTVRAADSGGLAPADLPAVDLDLLIRALAAPASSPALDSTVVHLEPPAEQPAVARRGGRKAAGRKAAKKTARKAVKAARGRKAASGDREVRAYRRMPDPDEVLTAYAQTGSITGLAEYYGVPRHTANGWARRLRQQGHSIGRS